MSAPNASLKPRPNGLELNPAAVIFDDLTRVAPDYTGALCAVGDDRWDLTPLLHKRTVAETRAIDFGKFPHCYRDTAKRLIWACLNLPTPVGDLDRPTATRTQLSPSSVFMYGFLLRCWMTWLADRNVTSLAAVSDEHFERYATHVAALGIERSVQANRLFAITRTWLYAPYLPTADRLARPPWETGAGRATVLGDANWSAENKTTPVHPQTMSALLLWSLRFINDFSHDIIAAKQMKSAIPEPDAAMRDLSPNQRFRAYMEHRRATSATIPGWYPPQQPGERCIAARFIGWQLGLNAEEAQSASPTNFAAGLAPEEEAGLPIAITGTIDGDKWVEAINFYDVETLCRHLATAAFIVTAYLTGMRGEECRALEHGCCTSTTDPRTGQTRHTITGRIFKGAIDHNGNTIPSGVEREHPWRAIAPVAKAVAVMEDLHSESRLLFPAVAFTPNQKLAKLSGAVSSRMLRDRIADFTIWCNDHAQRHNRAHEVIAADPDGPVTVRRFRRTLAWFVYRKPGGRIALGIQYGHLRGHTTDGYGSRVSSGLRDVFPMEEALASAEFLETAYYKLQDGENVTGPAAKRYVEGVRLFNAQFGGRYLTNRQAAALRSNPKLRIYDSDEQFVTCCYDQSKALCHPDRQVTASIEQTPDVTNCRPNCGNIARTDTNIARAEAAVVLHKAEVADDATPLPIRARLEQRITTLQAIIDGHRGKEVSR